MSDTPEEPTAFERTRRVADGLRGRLAAAAPESLRAARRRDAEAARRETPAEPRAPRVGHDEARLDVVAPDVSRVDGRLPRADPLLHERPGHLRRRLARCDAVHAVLDRDDDVRLRGFGRRRIVRGGGAAAPKGDEPLSFRKFLEWCDAHLASAAVEAALKPLIVLSTVASERRDVVEKWRGATAPDAKDAALYYVVAWAWWEGWCKYVGLSPDVAPRRLESFAYRDAEPPRADDDDDAARRPDEVDNRAGKG